MDEIFKITKNEEEVKALANMAKERFEDIKTEKKTFKIVQEYYEVVKELITAIMYRDGYKTLSHKKLIEYIKDNYEFESSEIFLIDDLRKLRNNLLYYGKSIDDSYLKNHEGELKKVIEKLFGILDLKTGNSKKVDEGFISIQEAMDNASKKKNVAVRGWVYRERGSNKMKFIVLRDSTNIIQCVLKKEDFSEEIWEQVDKLKIESSVEFVGEIKKDDRAPTGFEISVSDVKVIHIAEDFPINKDLNEELLGDRRHLWLRSRKITSSLKIRSTVLFSLHEFMHKNNFTEAQAPSLSGATSEGGSETFEVKYFDKKAYLTQSWQFYAENFINALEKVYAIAPSFRAEKSRTPWHVTEFWHFEVEAAWMKLEEDMKLAEECISYVIKKVIQNNKKELEILGADISKLKKVKTPFKRITYKEAIETLKKKGHKIKYGDDFKSAEERSLAKYYGDDFVFVTNYPLSLLKFYHGEDKKNPSTGTNFNLLAPGIGEVTDGSEREPDLEKLVERLKKAKINLGISDWYLDSRRYGSVPHSGFGLGVERFVAWICSFDTIKDAIPIPRTPTRLNP